MDAGKYHARLRTLQQFAEDAANEYDANPSEATAKYAVARRETGTSSGRSTQPLGTSLRLAL